LASYIQGMCQFLNLVNRIFARVGGMWQNVKSKSIHQVKIRETLLSRPKILTIVHNLDTLKKHEDLIVVFSFYGMFNGSFALYSIFMILNIYFYFKI
jgi:hypothetical protein